MRPIYLVMLGLFSTCSQAADWETIKESALTKISIDKQSIATKGKYKKAWVKFSYLFPQKTETSPEKTYDEVDSLVYVNCAEKTMGQAQDTKYYGHKMVETFSIDIRQVQFSESAPETIGETILNRICLKK